ncbi:EscS/YscS/HrcS family type III secretion system export apparatus protein [Rubrivivax gelatinosus]|uniref:EscS/YscS/HrcS family type III secretion system export apparatus protein n=1 Tax=Rubrivivax gelatinosus TaxID=28068 RepID=A0ABS1E0D3_RUBGE|nr:type III secretion system export apparatus subunit SctS [Rubrivivax gelatinosus]MBK1613164.1 EscS/YscS/HrcS family type III secretion system export apparatus protein [Rubrivivax gelatinosus]MBK1715836.1 EscS/YscS/HrcS family type III secretion system export apparatus protein [Rubrivivax gelatinosus]
MAGSEAMQLTLQALWLVLLLSAPPVLVAALVGLLIAIVQAATQIQEQTFQYAAKLFAIVLTIFVTASLLGGTLYAFSDRLFSDFAEIVSRP